MAQDSVPLYVRGSGPRLIQKIGEIHPGAARLLVKVGSAKPYYPAPGKIFAIILSEEMAKKWPRGSDSSAPPRP